jgi:hypothetical protein
MVMRYASVALTALILVAASPAPAPSGPEILDVRVLPEPLRVGKPLSIVVHTVPEVTSIQGRVFSYKFTVPKTGEGTFSARGRVPWFARLYHGTFQIIFTAVDAGGNRSEATATVRI